MAAENADPTAGNGSHDARAVCGAKCPCCLGNMQARIPATPAKKNGGLTTAFKGCCEYVTKKALGGGCT